MLKSVEDKSVKTEGNAWFWCKRKLGKEHRHDAFFGVALLKRFRNLHPKTRLSPYLEDGNKVKDRATI